MNNLVGLGEMKITLVEAGKDINNFYLNDMSGKKFEIFLSEDHSKSIIFQGEVHYTKDGELTMKTCRMNMDLYNAALKKQKIYDIVETGIIYEEVYGRKPNAIGYYEQLYTGFEFENVAYDSVCITWSFVHYKELNSNN
ncbi:hypothetical protein [Clostridium sp. AM33-3]|uniref:hypothetical protein n=1 Tax=Clostridium sp. AM33-3 TaxID=2292304 RepID=UPI000E472A0E|nr:hypothetical protein [Clostridium sp. AM33-3]RHT22908.1 hypothetical protein DW819_05210 [Clostridium sp. AM33-3]